MLAIRLQRTGRSGHAQFRVIVQDSRFSPVSGRVVAFLGSYNPHTKEAQLDKEKTAAYLANGAQPSDTAAKLLKKEGVKLPGWVAIAPPQKRVIKHPEKLRRNRPADVPVPSTTQTSPSEVSAGEPKTKEDIVEASAEEPQAEVTDVSAEEPKTDEDTAETIETTKPEEPTAVGPEPEKPVEEDSKSTDQEESPAESEAAEPESPSDKA